MGVVVPILSHSFGIRCGVRCHPQTGPPRTAALQRVTRGGVAVRMVTGGSAGALKPHVSKQQALVILA